MKPHHRPDNCELFCQEEYKRERFEKLFLWREPSRKFCEPLPCSKLYNRNKALLTTRCSLTYPSDRYPSDDNAHLIGKLPGTEYDFLDTHAQAFLWRQVKYSDLCCCTSKFYCSTSTSLEKCKNGCCGKCINDHDSTSSSCESDIDTDES